MASPSPASYGPDTTLIELVEAGGEWFVRIVEVGHEFVLSFELEYLALAYAESERIRLGLERFDRL